MDDVLLLLVVQLLLDQFLLLPGCVLARDGLSARPPLRSRENQVPRLLNLPEHLNSLLLSLVLGECSRRTHVDILVLQVRHAVLAVRHGLLRGFVR